MYKYYLNFSINYNSYKDYNIFKEGRQTMELNMNRTLINKIHLRMKVDIMLEFIEKNIKYANNSAALAIIAILCPFAIYAIKGLAEKNKHFKNLSNFKLYLFSNLMFLIILVLLFWLCSN